MTIDPPLPIALTNVLRTDDRFGGTPAMFYDVNGVCPAALKQTRRPADCCVPATRGTKRPPRETFKAERSQRIVRWVNVACVLPPSLFGEAGVRAGRDSGHSPKPPAGPRALSLQPAASLCASNAPRGAACLSADTALPVQATLSLRYLLLRDNPS